MKCKTAAQKLSLVLVKDSVEKMTAISYKIYS